jgi:enterochelin esterase-like enzyme
MSQAVTVPTTRRTGDRRAGDRRLARGLARRAARRAFAAATACVALVVAILAGTGWLYLMRSNHALAFGPRYPGALPLQQLAGSDTQPFGRMVAAWVPAGVALGVTLAAATRLGRLGRAATAAIGGVALLPLAASAADSLARNEPLRTHLKNGFSHTGVWAAIALLVAGVVATPRARAMRWLIALAVVGWAAWGIHGTLAYGDNYYKYRGFSPPHDPTGVGHGRLVRASFYSRALHRRRSYLVYLPHGYGADVARGERFPVYYFLHGSPGKPTGPFDIARMGVAYDELLHEHRIKPFLIVVPDGRNGTFKSDTEWANTRAAGNYASFVTDVVHAVDKRWPTIPRRRARMVAGYSEGGFGAMNLSLHELSTFGSFEAWSGYTHLLTTLGPFAGESPAQIYANRPDIYLPRVAARVRRLGLRGYLYSGAKDRSRSQVVLYSRELAAAGGRVTLSIFPGGHDWRLWRAHTPAMLLWASSTLGG